MKWSRRRFLALAGGGAVAGTGALAEGMIEARLLTTTFKSIGGLGLKAPLRVLHLSDFHASWCVPFSLIRKSVEMGMAHQPDLVFLTGDFVTSGEDDIRGYPEALGLLRSHPHCYACFGNHDGRYRSARSPSTARRIEIELAKVGVRFLHNLAVDVALKGSDLTIAGVGDLWRKEVRPDECLKRLPGGDRPTLLLAHNPDTKEILREHRWDVMFAGHTHGGQVVVPLFNWRPATSVEDQSMIEGVHAWEGRYIHVTRGVGNLHGIRVNCRPEVSLIDLS